MSPKAGKLLRGTAIAGLTGALLFVVDNISTLGVGEYTPIVVTIIGSAINALKVLAQRV